MPIDLHETATVEEKLDAMLLILDKFENMFDRLLPLIEKYERAANANSVFQARRALRGKGEK